MSNTITHCPHESYNGSNYKLGYAELLFSLTIFGLRLCSQAENSSAHKDIINLGDGKKVMYIPKDGATKVADSGSKILLKTQKVYHKIVGSLLEMTLPIICTLQCI